MPATKRKRVGRGRMVTHRRLKVNASMQTLADSMLAGCQMLFNGSRNLDTCVRDTVYEGLAHVVYAAYDTQACAQNVSDFDSISYIQTKTYEWFRSRDFVEWFCVAASTLFKNSRRDFYRYKSAPAKSGKAIVMTREKVA